MALQRTYNSQDDRPGPFGTGWTHAYDLRMQEENPTTNETDDTLNVADRTDFFGGKHKYHRDADGLYSPPLYHLCGLRNCSPVGAFTAASGAGRRPDSGRC